MTRFSRPFAVAALLYASVTFAQTVAVTPATGKATPVKMTTKAFDVGEILAGTEGKAMEENVDRLCRLIKGMVRPHTWDEIGGAGKLTFDARDCALTVNHSPEAIAEVKNLLDSLQRLGGPITVQLRVVRSSGKDSREALAKLCEKKPALLNEKELFAVMEKVAADRDTTVMQAPRLTVLAGESGTVSVCDTARFVTAVKVNVVDGKPVMVPTTDEVKLGTTFTATATPGKDGIELKLGYHEKQVDGAIELLPVTTLMTTEGGAGVNGRPVPVTQFVQMPKFRELKLSETLKLPDGGTVALFAGTSKAMKGSDFGPPVVSRVPYLNRLFKNVGTSEVDESVVVFASVERVKAEPAKLIPASATVPATDGEMAKLLAAYQRACESGKTNEAARLAVQALAKDPTCFKK